ncbi:hypothetical protein Q5752_005647 [Cryptotrichosporon argae]
MATPRLLVVGGNGFLGSAVCKAAVGKGWEVTSISQSGKPYTSPAGHSPRWSASVDWCAASAFEPASYAPLVARADAVVHTLGILLEDASYKRAVKEGSVLGVARALAGTWASPNPLKSEADRRSGYEGMNRDSALTVLDTVLASPAPGPSRFVYVSAADAFRPLIPVRYIETKREAEALIARRCADASVGATIVRPGLMYHAHTRPLSTLPAFLLSLTAQAHDTLRVPSPFASKSALGGAAEALATHPVHVDHVADAIVRAVAEGVDGVVDVQTMRRWAGFEGAHGVAGGQVHV